VKSAVIMANELKADAILVFTRRGHMARFTGWMRPRYSRIFAVCADKDVAESLTLSWGVSACVIKFDHDHPEETIEVAVRTLVERGQLKQGATLVIISSISAGEQTVDAVQMRTV
jgi:pyruvate kinase